MQGSWVRYHYVPGQPVQQVPTTYWVQGSPGLIPPTGTENDALINEINRVVPIGQELVERAISAESNESTPRLEEGIRIPVNLNAAKGNRLNLSEYKAAMLLQ